MEISWGNFKPRSTNRVPKLSLEKGEQARISVLQEAPRVAYVHNFEKILTNERGLPIEVTRTRADGSEYVQNKTEYSGKFRCLGDPDVMQSSGADPANCPACKGHVENPNAIRAATPRYLMQVLKYNTKPGTFAPVKPFGATLVVWDTTERRFEELVEIYNEHGDLRQKDLLLGPCEDKGYQKFNVQPGGDKAQWLANKEYVAELLADNPIEDLEGVAGKKPSEEEMRIKVSEIVRAFNHAHNISATSSSYESLLNSDAEKPVSKKAPVKDVTETPVKDAAEDSDDEEETFSEDDDSVDDTASLDDLLKSLGG